jgi:lipopolysaccharide biosynthesis glycosyltransferase
MSRFAYTTLVMLDYKYIIGAIVMAQSLKKTNTNCDIVCLATPDIYENKMMTDILYQHFTHVLKVDYIQLKTKEFKSKKRKDTYGKWIDKSYTKLSAMLLDQYEKVCILDSDMIITNNIDHLFNLQSPIGVFSNHWFDNVIPRIVNTKTCNFYKDILPLTYITPSVIHKALNQNGFVASGNIMVLTPSKDEFKEMVGILKRKQPFGFNCSSGADEQSICYYQSIIKKRNWTCLKQPYNVVPWKLTETLHPNQKPYVIHFNMTPKPWEMKRGSWDDIEIWWAYANIIPNIKEICLKLNLSQNNFNLGYCPYCNISKKKIKIHDLFDCYSLYKK